MTAPFYPQDLISETASLGVALAIGLAFGFFLERAGFGNSRKLTAQFYLYDMSVLKVMFTAIVTALVGLTVLSGIGWLDLSMMYLVPTFIVPQIVGGLLLGIGFVIGGYCPGTSVVGVATGRIDALVYAAGIFAGLAAYAEVFPAIAPWTEVTALGKVTWPQLLGLPQVVVATVVVVLALGAFAVAGRIERRYADRAQPDA